MADNFSNGEYQSGSEPNIGFITGVTFDKKEVRYSLIDGIPIFEGDIILDLLPDEINGPLPKGIAITKHRWTNGIIPYEIDSGLPNQARVINAISHWEEKTIIRFVQRTTSNVNQYPNYVQFRSSTGCSSSVGMTGGIQYINLANACTLGNTIHEIGHTVGLWHEQSREDRDDWITVHYANIEDGKAHNFDQHITDGDDIGPYDYASIMHYDSYAWSKNNKATITTQGSEPIGQRISLSAGDIATVWHMYHKLIQGEIVMSMKFACGSTIPGATNWKKYGNNTGIYLDVDTSAAGFTKTPKYFTSLGGKSRHWDTTGATSIYNASATSFRVYLRKPNGQPLITDANEMDWHINWFAIEN